VNYYVDSSVILRVLKGQKDAWKGWGRWEKAYCSTILRIECRRFIDRIRLEHAWSDEDVAAAGDQLLRLDRVLTHVRLSGAIMERASLPMPTTVKTLDAIHIATAALVRERLSPGLIFVTHDQQQGRAARALAFDCVES
jgi:predicted nucleic acid-binding protein